MKGKEIIKYFGGIRPASKILSKYLWKHSIAGVDKWKEIDVPYEKQLDIQEFTNNELKAKRNNTKKTNIKWQETEEYKNKKGVK